ATEMSYISSNQNRFYAALESGYGQVSAITAQHRIPAVKLATKQQLETPDRKDKTGSRTFTGVPAGGRRRTSFDLRTYMTSWTDVSQNPSYGALFQAGLGGEPKVSHTAASGSGTSGKTQVCGSAAGLTPGQAVTCSRQNRVVTA